MKLLLILIFVLVLGGCSAADKSMPTTDKPVQMDHSAMNHDMVVKSDQEFIEMMIPHHQEAIDSSRIMLEKTDNAELKKFLTGVIDMQTAEINQMRDWYGQWFGEYLDGGMYMPMMPDLESLQGEAAEQAYIEGMIEHHRGAIKMAEQLKSFTERSELKELANNIINAQSDEIELLNSWIK